MTGYAKLIESWGSDERIVEAARMSTRKGCQGWPQDERLLSYLLRNGHTSPFEMAGAHFEVRAPMFVIRQWQRHRTQSYNEESARYTRMVPENWQPSLERCEPVPTENKQAASDEAGDAEARAYWLTRYEDLCAMSAAVYREGLRAGVPREVARAALLTSQMVTMRASANLHNWLRFLRERLHDHAQLEIREPAGQVRDLLAEAFPRTMRLWSEL